MQISPKNIVIQLGERKTLAFTEGQGVCIECSDGAVWLTIEGQSGDYLLAKGERLHTTSKGLLVAQGLPSGLICLSYGLSKASIRNEIFDTPVLLNGFKWATLDGLKFHCIAR